MSVIRIHKNKNFTVMGNIHLRDKELSLKAKGLLSVMLSLPDNWTYSISGLCSICKENETAVKSTLKELREKRYVIVVKHKPTKENNGRFNYEYKVYEEPQPDPIQDDNILGVGFLPLENLTVENHPLYKDTNILNTDILSTKTKKDAFTNVNDRMDALKPEGYKGNGIKYISKTDYTEDQLKVYISHTIDTIMLNEYFIADAEDSGGLNLCAELKKIILYFYREYNKTFAEKHPILSDISYGNIADRYMNPSGRKMSEDGVKDFATYKEMIDRYFATDFGRYKRTPENFNYRLSHFMSDNVRENLYAKMI